MTLVEGIGDEVTICFVIVVLVVVGAVAWVSTSITEIPLIRTVLILERRVGHIGIGLHREIFVRAQEPRRAVERSIDTEQTVAASNADGDEDVAGATYLPCDANPSEEINEPAWSPENDVDHQDDEHEQSGSGYQESEGLPEMRSFPADAVPEEEVEHCSLQSLRRLSSEIGDAVPEPIQPEPEINDPYNLVGNIRIRLKYLNDDQKMVYGNLEEQLGDFRRRHFSPEISADKLVRLIFNGHVLQSDSETLQGCGLFDNCVVHCLVHSQRAGATNQPEQSTGREGNPSTNNTAAVEAALNRDWDMGNILLISLGLLLGVAWYCRFLYGQLFSATTTVALAGLTGILVISVVGLYLPDEDFVRR